MVSYNICLFTSFSMTVSISIHVAASGNISSSFLMASFTDCLFTCFAHFSTGGSFWGTEWWEPFECLKCSNWYSVDKFVKVCGQVTLLCLEKILFNCIIFLKLEVLGFCVVELFSFTSFNFSNNMLRKHPFPMPDYLPIFSPRTYKVLLFMPESLFHL